MEQQVESRVHVIQKQFGYGEIVWEIENYFFATCKKDWIIHSPDFSVYGLQVTKWRLSLIPFRSRYRRVIAACLERLETDPFPDAVRATWRFSYPLGESENVPPENSSIFERKTVAIKKLPWLHVLESHMQGISCNKFILRCRLIVDNKDGIIPNTPNDLGLKYLSQDLAVLCKVGKGQDVVLFVGEDVPAHKAILCQRNGVFRSDIEKCGPDREIYKLHFPCEKPDVFQDLISFLYTGNLDYIIKVPSIEMHELVNRFKVEELKSYFASDNTTFITRFGMQEFNFRWMIPIVDSTMKLYYSSPPWRLEILNTTFQLNLTKFYNKSGHLAIFGQFVNGEIPKEVYFECAILDANEKPHCFKYLYWTSKEKKMGFEEFISKKILKNPSFVIHGNLGITCKLGIPTGAQSQYVISSKTYSLVGTEINPTH